jgi:hypothetical protein
MLTTLVIAHRVLAITAMTLIASTAFTAIARRAFDTTIAVRTRENATGCMARIAKILSD